MPAERTLTMPTDVFRPRLPIDPFDDAAPAWQPDPDAAPAAPHTVLVLGAATHADLAPLVRSPLLAASLLVVATHTPPPVPEAPQCAVVVLRLPAPLDIHDAGAVRLVSVLARAQRVAHTWHAAPHAQPRIQQLAELYPGGEFSIAEPPEFALAAASVPAAGPRCDASETSSLASSMSGGSSSSTSSHSLPANKSATGQYTFSALINFLPPMLPDKALLKHAILVTTLSAPFLAPQPPPLPFAKRPSIFSSLSLSDPPRRRSRLVSLFSRSPPPSSYTPPSLASSLAPSAESLVAPAPARHAHLVHVLPYSAVPLLNPSRRSVPLPAPPKPKLVQSIEQFLLSFAYPPTATASAPSLASLSPPPLPSPPPVPPSTPTHRAAPARSSPLASPAASLRTVHSTATTRRQSAQPGPPPHPHSHAPAPPAIPYVLPAGLLGACPPGSARCVGEMVLCGVLDAAASGRAGGAWPRAWIGGPAEVQAPLESGFGRLGKQPQDEGAVPVEREKEKEQSPEREQEKETKTKTKRPPKRIRRNEAGLPTPPESSSSDDDDGSASDADAREGEREGTEDSHLSAPVLHTKSPEVSEDCMRNKATSEAHFGGGVRVRDIGRSKLGDSVVRFWGGLRLGRLVRLRAVPPRGGPLREDKDMGM